MVEMIKELGIEDELCINTVDSLYGSEGCRKEAGYYKKPCSDVPPIKQKKVYQTPEYDNKVQRTQEENCLVTR